MLFKKEEKSQNEFWQEYEEKTGEKVLKRGLGKYISGWDEFDKNRLSGIWGIVITTSGGFRFHHFPQYSWLDSMARFTEKEQKKEKTIFIPEEKLVGGLSALMPIPPKEIVWWKKLLGPPQRLIVDYIDQTGENRKLIFEAEYTTI